MLAGGRSRRFGADKSDALLNGKSLLAAGITSVFGEFERGDVIAIEDPKGRMIAKGMVEYDKAECEKIRGLRSEEVARRLGHLPRSAVIHRDQMVIL